MFNSLYYSYGRDIYFLFRHTEDSTLSEIIEEYNQLLWLQQGCFN